MKRMKLHWILGDQFFSIHSNSVHGEQELVHGEEDLSSYG